MPHANEVNRDPGIHTLSSQLYSLIVFKILELEAQQANRYNPARSAELTALRYEGGMLRKLMDRSAPNALPRCSVCGAEGARVGPRPGDEVCDNCRSDNHD